MSPRKAPSPRRIQELFRLFRIAPRPVLIHCKAGADRAGLAAALWKMVIDGAPQSEARRHLSICYGHMPLGPTQALDEFLENWAIPTKAKMDADKMTGELFNRSGYAADSPWYVQRQIFFRQGACRQYGTCYNLPFQN